MIPHQPTGHTPHHTKANNHAQCCGCCGPRWRPPAHQPPQSGCSWHGGSRCGLRPRGRRRRSVLIDRRLDGLIECIGGSIDRSIDHRPINQPTTPAETSRPSPTSSTGAPSPPKRTAGSSCATPLRRSCWAASPSPPRRRCVFSCFFFFVSRVVCVCVCIGIQHMG